MNKEFVKYEQALALKELGFNESCLAFYNLRGMGLNEKFNLKPRSSQYVDVKDLIALAPTYSQAFRFFREKHGLYVDLFVDDDKTFGFMISYFMPPNRVDKPIQRRYKIYEEAELECLKKLIEIVKKMQRTINHLIWMGMV